MNKEYSLYKIHQETGEEDFVLKSTFGSIVNNYIQLVDPDYMTGKNRYAKYLVEVGGKSEFNILGTNHEFNNVDKIGVIRP